MSESIMQEYKWLFADHYVEHVTNLSESMGNTMELWWTTSGWMTAPTGHCSGQANQVSGDSFGRKYLGQ